MEELRVESQPLRREGGIKKTHLLKSVSVIITIINCANFCLVVMKGVAAYVSKSFSIGTSAIESFGDVFVGALILAQNIMDKRVKGTSYPRGKSSDATTNIVAASVMMSLASVNWIIGLDALITNNLKADFGPVHITVVLVNIVTKLFLFGLCRIKRDNNQIYVLMRDQLTDVVTNSVALVAVCLSHFFWKPSDFVGASIIALVIFKNWIPIVNSSWYGLQGVVGQKEENEMIRKIIIEHVDRCQSFAGFQLYHLGDKLIVELFADFLSIDDQVFVTSVIDEVEEVQKCYVMPASFASGQSAVEQIEMPSTSTSE